MLKSTVKNVLRHMGYEIHKAGANGHAPGGEGSYKLHQCLGSDGSFDYEQYRRVQTAGNHAKIGRVWVLEENVTFLASYLLRTIGEPRFGLCHGTRRGLEQAWFMRDLPGCKVLGTEISDTATQFPDTIQWDFHEAKPEWIGAVDFIYSNSFDHSYKPEECLNTWMDCVRAGGVCLLEHSSLHGPAGADELDPFGADLVLLPYLIASWARGRYGVSEILDAPARDPSLEHLKFLVIRKF